jgi:multiple sugar transport system permease protein
VSLPSLPMPVASRRPARPAQTGGGPRRAQTVSRPVALSVVGILFLVPFLWMVSTSFKNNQQALKTPPELLSLPLHPEQYTLAMDKVPLLHYALNTLIVCLFSCLGAVVSNVLIAYGFARLRWPGRDKVFFLALSTLMLPFQVVMIPLFVTFAELGWTNTFLPLIVPCFFGNAFYIFLLRQFMMGIPQDYSDAARVDGANEWRILWRVIVPMCRPAIAAVALFQFLFSWNDFLAPLIYLNDQSKFTLSLGLAQMQSNLGLTETGAVMAAATLVVLPAVVVFLAAQRFFVTGISSTGIKG